MRTDLFTPIHKALRRNLFETAIALGRTDFTSPQETAAAEKLVAECLGFLREHADHEDRHVLPEIARLAPELAASMPGRSTPSWSAPRSRSTVCGRASRPSGRRNGRRWAASSRAASRRWSPPSCVTWTARSARSTRCSGRSWTDRDIGALSRRIVVSIPPARLLHWQQQVLLPAWSAPEVAAAAARMPSPI